MRLPALPRIPILTRRQKCRELLERLELLAESARRDWIKADDDLGNSRGVVDAAHQRYQAYSNALQLARNWIG